MLYLRTITAIVFVCISFLLSQSLSYAAAPHVFCEYLTNYPKNPPSSQWAFIDSPCIPKGPDPKNPFPWHSPVPCTWWAQETRLDERFSGNADQWITVAHEHHYPTGFTPVVGATVYFAPGVDGAGSLGHVAHVEKVYPDHVFIISEMDFAWKYGKENEVGYRAIPAPHGGVEFIY